MMIAVGDRAHRARLGAARSASTTRRRRSSAPTSRPATPADAGEPTDGAARRPEYRLADRRPDRRRDRRAQRREGAGAAPAVRRRRRAPRKSRSTRSPTSWRTSSAGKGRHRRRRRGAQRDTCRSAATSGAATSLKKTIKGSETSIFVGLAAGVRSRRSSARCSARSPATTASGSTTSSTGSTACSARFRTCCSILAVAAVLQQKGMLTIILILGLTGWTGVFRLIRARVPEAQGARIRAGGRRDRRVERAPHVRPHLPQRVATSCSCSCRSCTVGFIKAEVILSFLGFGVPVDVVSWGSMLNEAQNELILGKWWQLVAGDDRDGRARHRVHRCSPTRCATRSIRSSKGLRPGALNDRDTRTTIRWSACGTCSVVVPPRPRRRRSRRSRASRSTSRRTRTVALVGESGSGKVGDVARDPRPAAAGELDHRSGERDRCSAAATCVRHADRRRCAQLRGADISMIFQEPMTSLNPVFTVGFQLDRGAAAAHGHVSRRRRASARSSCWTRSASRIPRQRIDAYPSQTVGRPAAARDDRDGDRLRAEAPDRRRAAPPRSTSRSRSRSSTSSPRCRRSTRCRCCSSRTTSRSSARSPTTSS